MPTPIVEKFSRDVLRPGEGTIVSDPYDIARLRQELTPIGFNLLFYPQIPTTMGVIEEQALAGNISPLVALTDHQTQGIGREGRDWHDVPGKSILMSVLIRGINESAIATYADLVALSICRTLRQETAQSVQLKWPNDVVHQDRKVGGILTKNVYDGTGKHIATNVGIGINVHQTDAELPPTDYGAGSLDSIAGRALEREFLVMQIVKAISEIGPDAEIIRVNPTTQAVYNHLWQESSSLLNRTVRVEGKDESVEGTVIDTQIGQGLVLQTASGQRKITIFDPSMKVRII